MLPGFALNNESDVRRSHAVLRRYSNWRVSGSSPSADVEDLRVYKFGRWDEMSSGKLWIFSSPMLISKARSALTRLIGLIVGGTPSQKMSWIYTTRIITRMSNIASNWINSMLQKIGKPICSQRLTSKAKFSVAASRYRFFPKPAVIHVASMVKTVESNYIAFCWNGEWGRKYHSNILHEEVSLA